MEEPGQIELRAEPTAEDRRRAIEWALLDKTSPYPNAVIRRAQEYLDWIFPPAVSLKDIALQNRGLWTVNPTMINGLENESIASIVDLAKRAHTIDIVIRKDGVGKHFQGDWIKHLEDAR